MAKNADRDRLIRHLNAILDAPGTSARALAAKSTAARQLGQLLGLSAGPVETPDVAENGVDPMLDLDQLAPRRLRRR